MSAATFLCVALAGGVGACARFWLDRGTQRALSAAIAAVAQRYAYKGSQKWLTPKLEARFGAPQLEA